MYERLVSVYKVAGRPDRYLMAGTARERSSCNDLLKNKMGVGR